MAKHILMYEGIGPSLSKAQEIISNSQGVTLVETLGENIIVEANAPAVRGVLNNLPGWRKSAVRKVAHPDNRIRVKRT